MSSSMQSVVHALGPMLNSLLQGEESIRKPAESELHRYVTHATYQTFQGLALIAQGAGAYPPESRILALLLLRRQPFISITPVQVNDPPTYFPFDALTDEQVDGVFRCLIGCLETELDGRIRRGLADTVGKWMEEWKSRGRDVPELLPVLLRLATSTTPAHRLSVYQLIIHHPTILFTLSFTTSTSHGSPIPLKSGDVAQLLSRGMEDEFVDVRLAAVKAVQGVLEGDEIEDEGREEVGSDLVGKACHVLTTLSPEKFSIASTPLTSILATYPHLFEPHLENLYKYLLSLCLPPLGRSDHLPLLLQPSAYTAVTLATTANTSGTSIHRNGQPPTGKPDPLEEEMEEERYSAALEFLLTLIETADFGPLRKVLAEDKGAMVRMLLGRMYVALGGVGTEEEDLREWLDADDLDEINEDYPNEPEDALLRLFNAIPQSYRQKDKASSLILEPIRQLLQLSEWRGRHTGLMALSAVMSSVIEDEEDKEKTCQEILGLLQSCVSDPHPRVRYAVMYTIGQMALAFEEEDFPASAADTSLRALCIGFDCPEPRIQCQSALSLVNLTEVTTSDVDPVHVEALVTRMVKLMQTGPKFTQEECTTALAYLALIAERNFAPYTSHVMNMLLEILQTADGDNYRLLRCRAFEASGIIAVAVGKKTAGPHLDAVAKELMKAQAAVSPDDDFQASYLAQTWSKIARVMESDFAPYVQYVIPDLLRKASARPTIQPLESDSAEDEVQLPPGMEIVDFDSTSRIAIDSKAMEEKALAFEALPEYLSTLDAMTFAPFLDQALMAALETVDFIWEPTARVNAIATLPQLLEHAKTLQQPEKISPIFTALNSAILRETDTTYLASLYRSFTNCLEVLASPLPQDVRKLFEDATEFQLSGFEEVRKLRCDVAHWSLAERREEFEIQKEENDALQAIAGALKQINPKHRLFAMLGVARSYKLSKNPRDEEET